MFFVQRSNLRVRTLKTEGQYRLFIIINYLYRVLASLSFVGVYKTVLWEFGRGSAVSSNSKLRLVALFDQKK